LKANAHHQFPFISTHILDAFENGWRSLKTSLGKTLKKNDDLICKEEERMLANRAYGLNFPFGTNHFICILVNTKLLCTR